MIDTAATHKPRLEAIAGAVPDLNRSRTGRRFAARRRSIRSAPGTRHDVTLRSEPGTGAPTRMRALVEQVGATL